MWSIGKMKKSIPHGMLIGEAGVHRVASELLKRGIQVYFPAIDNGIDLFANRIALQVKTASRSKTGQYAFNFKSWRREDGKPRYQKMNLHNDVRFVVLWGLDEDLLWVVPANVLRKSRQVQIGCALACSYRGAKGLRYSKYLGNWHNLCKKAR